MDEDLASDIVGGLGTAPPEATPAPEPVSPAAEPAAATPAAAEVPAASAPVEPTPVPPGHVPLSAVLDEREKRQAAEKRLADLEAQQKKAAPSNLPSFRDDPDAAAEALRAETRFEVSESLARQVHGDEKVAAAMEWGMQRASQSKAFAAEYLGQRNPIDWIVKQHKRDDLMTEVGDDADAFVRRRAEEMGLVAPGQPAAVTPVTPAPASPAPRPSLASAPSAGGPATVATGPMAAFEAIPD